MSVDANNTPRPFAARILSDALIISALTGLAYVMVYAFEYGYCHYFRIPPELITVSLTNLVVVASIVIFCTGYGAPFLFHVLRLDNISTFSLLFVESVVLVVAFGASLWVLPCSPLPDWLFMAVKVAWPVLWVVALALLWSLRRRRPVKQDAWPRRGWMVTTPLEARFLLTATFILFFALLVCAYVSGMYRAALRNEFIMTTESKQRVVLAIYGDQAVVADYNGTTRSVGPDFELSEVTQLPRLTLKLTGRLSCTCPTPARR